MRITYCISRAVEADIASTLFLWNMQIGANYSASNIQSIHFLPKDGSCKAMLLCSNHVMHKNLVCRSTRSDDFGISDFFRAISPYFRVEQMCSLLISNNISIFLRAIVVKGKHYRTECIENRNVESHHWHEYMLTNRI